MLQKGGFNPSLPLGVFDSKGNLMEANGRMAELLGVPGKFPVSREQLSALWPFFNEEDSAPALLGKVLKSPHERSFFAEAHLKTYRIRVKKVGRFKVVAAELLRSGDLLKDVESRQALFRTLSHEIRTAVAALRGYTGMIKEGRQGSADSAILDRMESSLKRLDKVIGRLSELRLDVKEGARVTNHRAPPQKKRRRR
jgi:signal transduction histidine kinase